MKIEYAPGYVPANTIYLAVHNTGGLENKPFASTQNLTAEAINTAHKQRFNMISSLGYYGAYNFLIEASGKRIQFRAIGEETMAQTGHNFSGEAISVCFTGNATIGVDRPTQAQEQGLIDLYKELPQVLRENIVPHRILQPGHTECYGSGLSDSWARDLLMPISKEETIAKLQKQISLLQMLIDLYIKFNALKTRFGFAIFGGMIPKPCYLQDNRG